jgi:hypothetical protein
MPETKLHPAYDSFVSYMKIEHEISDDPDEVVTEYQNEWQAWLAAWKAGSDSQSVSGSRYLGDY